MNYFTDTLDTKLFGTKLASFCNDYYIAYVYWIDISVMEAKCSMWNIFSLN